MIKKLGHLELSKLVEFWCFRLIPLEIRKKIHEMTLVRLTSRTSQASRIAESKRSTYAEAVKKHDERFMKGINEHSSLKRNNPFLYHLTKLI